MESATDKNAPKGSERDALRQRLLQMIVKNEARRRERREVSGK